MNKRKTAIVICPGRGSYSAKELGYLGRHQYLNTRFIQEMDIYRQEQNQIYISKLDQTKRFSANLHIPADNASLLIYSCALADYQKIDKEKFDILAVTGNSMGWYLSLAASGVIDLQQGAKLVNSMGKLMHESAEGGQILYPLCDEHWRFQEKRKLALEKCINTIRKEFKLEVNYSIHLGHMAVIAGEEQALKQLCQMLPKIQDQYPMRLLHHHAYHTSIMQAISVSAKSLFPVDFFSTPKLPLIDGRGHIWQSYNTDIQALHSYTLEEQVCKTFDYSKAIEVACKEFAPDCFIILGPGTTLVPPTAQILIDLKWQEFSDKESFKQQQRHSPFIFNMATEEQRHYVTY